MQVTFYASKPMARLLKKRSGVELTQLSCDDPALVGRVPLQSTTLHVAWQLHVIQTNRDHGDQSLSDLHSGGLEHGREGDRGGPHAALVGGVVVAEGR